MKSYSLAAFEIRVFDDAAKGHIRLDRLTKNQDLFELFRQFLLDLGGAPSHDDEQKRILRLRQGQPPEEAGRLLMGLFESGDYGAESDIVDSSTGQNCGKILKPHAVMKRFFFRVDLPTESERGILLLQRESNLGIQDAFRRSFEPFFRGKCPGLRFEMNALAPEEVIKHYLDPDRVTKIRLIKHSIPAHYFKFFDDGLTEVDGYVEIIVHAKRKGTLPLLNRFRSLVRNQAIPTMLSIPELQPDEVKVQVQVGKHQRTVNVTNLANLRASFDISHRVGKLAADGHPAYDALKTAAQDVADEIASRMKLVVENVGQG